MSGVCPFMGLCRSHLGLWELWKCHIARLLSRLIGSPIHMHDMSVPMAPHPPNQWELSSLPNFFSHFNGYRKNIIFVSMYVSIFNKKSGYPFSSILAIQLSFCELPLLQRQQSMASHFLNHVGHPGRKCEKIYLHPL